MDLAHRHHFQHQPVAVLQNPPTYGLHAEPSTGPYGMTMESQRIPRSLGPLFSLQTSTLNQPPAPGLQEQPWPQRLLSEIRDLLFLLRPDGRVLYASPSCKSVTGFDAGQLEHNLLSRFIHDDDKAVFARELDECIAVGRPLQCHFRVYKIDNSSCLLEANGHPHITELNNQRQFCHGVFLMCRPYPTRSAQLLDSFLEHKIENIRLTERIKLLKEEEEEDLNASQQAKQAYAAATQATRQAQYTAAAATAAAPFSYASGNEASVSSAEENESSDTLANESETQPLLDQAIIRAAAEGEDMSHIDGIELMTGLHYGEGERSQGISTGVRHSRLVQCTGIPIDPTGERRKRMKGEYMCTDCGTSDSPEWRKGPEGPKTLCNACGLRWAKKEKKRQDSS